MHSELQRAVRSADGTSIGYDSAGTGDPLIFVTGATNDRTTASPLAAALTDSFTCVTYDRRGRGASGDTQPYSIECEVQDIAALLAEHGGTGHVFGFSSGAILALRAAVDGLPLQSLTMYEPPLFMAGSAPASTTEHVRRLNELIAEGKPGDAMEYFQTEIIGMPREALEGQRNAPFWPGMEAVAPTLAYDQAICGDQRLSAESLAQLNVPTFALSGDATFPGLSEATDAVAALIPGATRRTLAGQGHELSAEAVAPLLRELLVIRPDYPGSTLNHP